MCDANEAAPRDERTTIGTVPQHQPLLAAVDLDQMTPDERAGALAARVVTDLDTLPDDFRQRVVDTGARLATERRAAPE